MEAETKGHTGRYRIRGEAGLKGVNLVCRGYDDTTGREVAIRRVDPGCDSKHRYTPDDLVKDAIALASIRHPNFIAIYDYGKDREGPFVITEPVQGVILESTLEKKVFLLDDFIELVKQTLESLIAAHGAGLSGVHLDPWNIMLVRQPGGRFRVKVLGMGRVAAKALPINGGAYEADRRGAGEAVPGREIPPFRGAEFLSLGRLYYQALTGRRPFGETDSLELLGNPALEKLPSCREFRPNVPERLCDWTMGLIRSADRDPAIKATRVLDQFLSLIAVKAAPASKLPATESVKPRIENLTRSRTNALPRKTAAALRPEPVHRGGAAPVAAGKKRDETTLIPLDAINSFRQNEIRRGAGENRPEPPGGTEMNPVMVALDEPNGSDRGSVVLRASGFSPPVIDREEKSPDVESRNAHDVEPASVDHFFRRLPTVVVVALLGTSLIVLAGSIWKTAATGYVPDTPDNRFAISEAVVSTQPMVPVETDAETGGDAIPGSASVGAPGGRQAESAGFVSERFHAAASGRSLPETLAEILAEARNAEGAGDDLAAFRHYLAAVEKFPGEDASIDDLTRYVESLSNRSGDVLDFLEESLVESAEQGVGPAMRILGERSSALGRWEDAVNWLGRASVKKDVRATMLLGLLLSEGKGAPRDMEAAVECFEWAARHGDHHAAYLAGECYVLGKGVDKDPEKGVAYLNDAAAKGEVRALDLIGVCHVRGIGVRVNYESAYSCFQSAADRGYAGALANLGVLYMNGQGVEKDAAVAVKFFREGVERENARSMYLYARCLDEGLGVAKNRSAAEEWYRKAMMQGSSEARRWIAEHDPKFAE